MTNSFSRGGSGGRGGVTGGNSRLTYEVSGTGFKTNSVIELIKFVQQTLRNKKTQESNKSDNKTARSKKRDADTSLTRPMEAMAVGDHVPVVFCRRRTGGTGGVMVKPRATECRFANTATTIEAAYHCVLGHGYIYAVQVRDVRNGPNRQGSYSQNWNLRAGTWRPERLVTEQDGYNVPDFPQNCGGGGDYIGITTIEFRNTYNPKTQLDGWKVHWSAFVRNGMRIDRGRVFDGVVGASDNFCDLYIWAQISAGLMVEADFDMTEMLKAAKFLEANQLFCNAEFSDGASLPDFLASTLPAFLLRETSISGKFSLRPVLPTNDDGTINTGSITPEWIFDERSIAPGSYKEAWTSAADRKLIQVNVLWRQQASDTEIPLIRDLQVMAEGVANPEVQTFDLSQIATSEAHAAIAGGYRQGARALGQGTASVRLLAGSQTGLLRAGMIVQVIQNLVTETELPDQVREFWWIDSITLDSDGSESLTLLHCPVDAQGRSLLALHVVAARDRAPGHVMPYPGVGVDDEPGRSADTTIPTPTTSGIPISQGGGGGTTSFNRTRPPAPPPSSPPAPPSDGGGGTSSTDTADAGGAPTDPAYGPRRVSPPAGFIPPSRRAGGATIIDNYGPLNPQASPYECDPYGVQQIRTLIEGATNTGTVVNYVVVTIEPVTAEVYDAIPLTYTPPGETSPVTIICNVYKVRVQEQIPNAPRTFDVVSVEGPGLNFPFNITVLDWRCRLRDGSIGPTRTPSDPPLVP